MVLTPKKKETPECQVIPFGYFSLGWIKTHKNTKWVWFQASMLTHALLHGSAHQMLNTAQSECEKNILISHFLVPTWALKGFHSTATTWHEMTPSSFKKTVWNYFHIHDAILFISFLTNTSKSVSLRNLVCLCNVLMRRSIVFFFLFNETFNPKNDWSRLTDSTDFVLVWNIPI